MSIDNLQKNMNRLFSQLGKPGNSLDNMERKIVELAMKEMAEGKKGGKADSILRSESISGCVNRSSCFRAILLPAVKIDCGRIQDPGRP